MRCSARAGRWWRSPPGRWRGGGGRELASVPGAGRAGSARAATLADLAAVLGVDRSTATRMAIAWCASSSSTAGGSRRDRRGGAHLADARRAANWCEDVSRRRRAEITRDRAADAERPSATRRWRRCGRSPTRPARCPSRTGRWAGTWTVSDRGAACKPDAAHGGSSPLRIGSARGVAGRLAAGAGRDGAGGRRRRGPGRGRVSVADLLRHVAGDRASAVRPAGTRGRACTCRGSGSGSCCWCRCSAGCSTGR